MAISVTRLVDNLEGGNSVVDGKEYVLRTTYAGVKKSQNGNLMIVLAMEGTGALTGLTVWDNWMLIQGSNLTAEEQVKTQNYLTRTLRDYIAVVGHAPVDGFPETSEEAKSMQAIKDLVGRFFSAVLENGERQDKTPTINVRRYIEPVAEEEISQEILFEVFQAEATDDEVPL